MGPDLFVHPLATPAWESVHAAPIRLGTRAFWAENRHDETLAPRHRVIHARAAFAAEPMHLETLRVVEAAGYHKCASGQERDGALRVRVRTPEGTGWRSVADLAVTAEAIYGGGVEIDLGGIETTALVAEVREAATDRWWPGWNLVTTGLQLHGRPTAPWAPAREGHLDTEVVDLRGLPAGVAAEHRNSEIRYRTRYLDVGFRLRSPAWSHLGLDIDGESRTGRNLLQMPRSMDIVRSGVYPSGVYPVLRDQNAEYLAQGPRLATHDGRHLVGFLATDYVGTTRVHGNRIVYDFEIPGAGQRYRLAFTVLEDRIRLEGRRSGDALVRAWSSSAWHVATDNRVTPSCALGSPTRSGETGLLDGEVLWHFPRYGSLRVGGGEALTIRSDSVRPLDTNTFELKLGETATAEGDYLLEPGDHESVVEFVVAQEARQRVRPETPPAVRRMLSRHTATSLPFRADTATYSNNGASMHCTTSLVELSAIAERSVALLPHVTPMDWVGLSLERWLDGAPSYGSGPTSHGPHRLEDEYIHLAANTLIALARYLASGAPDGWFAGRRDRILAEIEGMLARDVDDDGLVESVIRRGVSGEHQWSTAWSDVISFGGKDAWANASLFEAWTLMAPVLQELGESELADRVTASAAAIRSAYLPAFFNDESGLVAGWRSPDGALHDYGFSLVNGAACSTDLIDLARAREIMERLVRSWDEAGIRDLRNGLPLNLRRIPESDIGGVVFGLPMGGYQQGGMSHHGARVVVDALDRVGMTEEADRLIVALAETIADDSSFGGVGSGLDWRMWDGTPSGYEGQLVEGFSIIASALRRYAVDS